MQGFIITLLTCSVTMLPLALIYMLITPLLAKHYSVTGRYYAWLVIVIGLIIPFRPQFNNAIVNVNMPAYTIVTNIQNGNKTPITAPVKNVLPSAITNILWWQIAGMVWIAGIILFLSYHVIKHCRFLKLTAHWSSSITDELTLTILQNLKTQMGLSINIGLQLCESIGSPMMTGFIKPRILLPRTDFTKEELCFILKHELVHYKRKDLWYKGLVLIATAVHWFNPIVYLMSKAIAAQCELSCDEAVIHNTSADTRQRYTVTILGVVRHQSKLITSLSTNFNGGKKSMKKRIISIMDMSKKKSGLAILCGILVLTMGTSFVFAANKDTQGPSEIIKEDIMLSYSYRFLPDPEIYANYSSYGITISEDGKMLLYNGQRVRLFVDEHSDNEAFFLDEEGALDLTVNRNAHGKIIGIKSLPKDKAQEFRSAFFEDTQSTESNASHSQDIAGQNKYDQYFIYGIKLSSDGETLNYKGQRVKFLADVLSDGSFETLWSDAGGTANLSVIRDKTNQITSVENISEEKVQKYQSAADDYEQNILDGLEEKIVQKLKAKYPEN